MTGIFSHREAAGTDRSNSDRPEAAPSPFRPAMRANADAGMKARAQAIPLIGHWLEGVNTKIEAQCQLRIRDIESEFKRQRIEGAAIAGLCGQRELRKKTRPVGLL